MEASGTMSDLDRDPPKEGAEFPSPIPAGSELTIGMYHPWAGTTHAGGIATYVQKICQYLPHFSRTYLYTVGGTLTDEIRNSDVTVVELPADAGGMLENRLFDRCLPYGIAKRLPIFRNLLSEGIVRRINDELDVLVTHDYLDEIVLSNLVDVPVVRIHHGLRDVGIGAKVRERSTKARRTVANSRYTSDEIARHFGYEADDIVYPGVELDAFRPGRTPAFDPDGVAVLYVGRFTENKGIYDLLEAFTNVDEDATLYIVGRGDEERVRARARELGIEASVSILGEVPHGELPGYYAACDLLCNPSHYESFGMVNLEAMASGTPLVTTETGGVLEYSDHMETGLHVPAEDPTALADAINALVAAPETRERMGVAARETATSYSWELSARQLNAICVDVCYPDRVAGPHVVPPEESGAADRREEEPIKPLVPQ